MDTLTLLQHYWWLLISLLCGVLVFLLFVQGGQSQLYLLGRTPIERDMIVNSVGRKWEFTFTTLVVFGGSFFASFPLFYSTSFGGAYYVWMAILLLFVVQAVSFQFRRKAGNLFGERTYDWLLRLNGWAAPLLLGVALGTLFTGADFTVDRLNLANEGGEAVISQWGNRWHGLEALADYRNVALGLAVLFLSQLLAQHYFLNDIDDLTLRDRIRRRSLPTAIAFLLFFLLFFVSLLLSKGWGYDPSTGEVSAVPGKYLDNLLRMQGVAIVLVTGVLFLLAGIAVAVRCASRRAIWLSGIGTVMAVTGLLLLAGWNHTCYYPSLTSMQSSLTIANSSSSLFTLRVMSWVSLLLPVVIAYIWIAWRSLNVRRITREGMEGEDHTY